MKKITAEIFMHKGKGSGIVGIPDLAMFASDTELFTCTVGGMSEFYLEALAVHPKAAYIHVLRTERVDVFPD